MSEPRIIQFPNAAKIFGADRNIIAEVMRITPADATAWLRCNRNNRPVRKRHVELLASEIINGNWQVNGQAIVIAEDENVLDGQHRLFAIIEAGIPIQSLVVYGITPEAFSTIDTGAVRTGADALCLHFHDVPAGIVKAASVAVQWCKKIERGVMSSNIRIGNTDVIAYVKDHMSLISCAEELSSYPREARPMSIGSGTALYEMFSRKDEEKAATFMQRFYTGEDLVRTDPEYILRTMFMSDADKIRKLPHVVRMRMVINGWNWLRRGNKEATRQSIVVKSTDDQKVRIF